MVVVYPSLSSKNLKKPKRKQSASSKSLEVGTVYRQPKNDRLFLAVAPLVLVGYTNEQVEEWHLRRVDNRSMVCLLEEGRVKKKQPRAKWMSYRNCSVEELLLSWEISSDVLDDITKGYLQPSLYRGGKRQHNKGGQPSNDALAEAFYRLRLCRLFTHTNSS